MEYEIAFLQALALTVSLEVIAAAALKKFFGRRLALQEKYPRLLATVALASLLTLPYVWFIFPAFIQNGMPYIVVSELFAFVAEAAWYAFALRINIKNAVILSLAANALSYLIGNVIF